MLNMLVCRDGAERSRYSPVSEYSNSKPTTISDKLRATPRVGRFDGVWFAPTNAVRSADAGRAMPKTQTTKSAEQARRWRIRRVCVDSGVSTAPCQEGARERRTMM